MGQQGGIAVSDMEQPISIGFFAKLTKYVDNMTTFIMRFFKWNAALLMALIVFEVTMRYIFKAPTFWGLDVQTYISAGGRVIGFGYAFLMHSHITMDIFTVKLSFRKSKALELFNYLIFGIPLMTAITWVTLERGVYALQHNEKFYTVWRPATWPVIMFVVASYALMMVQILAEIIKDIISLRNGSDVWLKHR